jgi:hypothetical protein
MRFMTLIKSAESSRLGQPPAELIHAIARFGGEATHADVLIDTAGMLPTAGASRG